MRDLKGDRRVIQARRFPFVTSLEKERPETVNNRVLYTIDAATR